MVSQGNSAKSSDCIILVLQELFQITEKERNIPSNCYETSSTIIPKDEIEGMGKEATGHPHV